MVHEVVGCILSQEGSTCRTCSVQVIVDFCGLILIVRRTFTHLEIPSSQSNTVGLMILKRGERLGTTLITASLIITTVITPTVGCADVQVVPRSTVTPKLHAEFVLHSRGQPPTQLVLGRACGAVVGGIIRFRFRVRSSSPDDRRTNDRQL